MSDLENFKSQFFRDGYIVLPALMANELLDEVVNDCDGNYSRDKKYLNEERRIQDFWNQSSAVKSVASAAAILDILEFIFDKKPFPFQTLNFERGTEQPLHADTIHFCSFPARYMVGVWVALEDVSYDNGPLIVYPKSHVLPLIDCYSSSFRHAPISEPYKYYSEYESYIDNLIANIDLPSKAIIVNKGDVVIWASNLIHGGSPISVKDTTRLSQVTHYFFEDCFYFTPLNSDQQNSLYALRRPFNIVTGKKVSILDFIRGAIQNGFSWTTLFKSILYTIYNKFR